jgi:hypothetical protein
MMGNCLGEKTVHSGPAFGNSYLSYASREFTIPKESLFPGQPLAMDGGQTDGRKPGRGLTPEIRYDR